MIRPRPYTVRWLIFGDGSELGDGVGDGEPNCDGRGAKGLPRGCAEAVGCEVANIVLKMALG